MLQSQPPPLTYASNLFKFSKIEHNDELQSLPDDESISSLGSYSRERKSPSIDQEELPLNLSCKRKQSNDNESEPITFNEKAEVGAIQFQEQPNVKNVERAILQYRNHVLASNDFFRNYIQQKWKDELNARSQQYQAAKTSANSFVELNERRAQWLAMMNAIQNFGSGQRCFNQENSLSDHAKERMSVIVQPNVSPPVHLNPTNAISADRLRRMPSPPYVSSSFFPQKLPPRQEPISPKQPSSPALMFRPLMKLTSGDDLKLSVKRYSPTAKSTRDLPIKKRQKTKSNDLRSEGNENTESFRCTVCGATYPHKFELNRHVKVSHIRPHRCGQCGKGFGHRNYLKVHIETVHLGRKSHQCRLCGKYLSTGGNLNVHVRTIHLGEKKYDCPVCSRSFGQQCNMKTHMKRHFTKGEDL